MTEQDWGAGFTKTLGVFLNGEAFPTTDLRGRPLEDDSFYLAFNAHTDPATFTLPPDTWGAGWQPVIDTAVGFLDSDVAPVPAGAQITVAAMAVVVLQRAGVTESPVGVLALPLPPPGRLGWAVCRPPSAVLAGHPRRSVCSVLSSP